jgi:hypothetical protein
LLSCLLVLLLRLLLSAPAPAAPAADEPMTKATLLLPAAAAAAAPAVPASAVIPAAARAFKFLVANALGAGALLPVCCCSNHIFLVMEKDLL